MTGGAVRAAEGQAGRGTGGRANERAGERANGPERPAGRGGASALFHLVDEEVRPRLRIEAARPRRGPAEIAALRLMLVVPRVLDATKGGALALGTHNDAALAADLAYGLRA